MSYYIIRTRCPNGCKYKSGNTCVASECPYQTGYVRYDIRMNAEDKPTKINAQVKQAVKEFAEKLKNRLSNCSGCYIPDCFESPTNEFAYNATEAKKIIDELLKEYEK